MVEIVLHLVVLRQTEQVAVLHVEQVLGLREEERGWDIRNFPRSLTITLLFVRLSHTQEYYILSV